MKKALQFLVLISILLITFSPNAEGQKKKRKKSKDVDEYFDDRGSFKDRLWYGGGLNLGFGGSGNISSFQFGLSPMVGYKITDRFSVGPRISVDYNYIKGPTVAWVNNGPQVKETGRQASGIVSYSGGVFARFKFVEMLFAHTEYGYEISKIVQAVGVGNQTYLLYDEATDKLVTFNDNRNHAYLGLGYLSGNGVWGYEILALYDFLVPESEAGLPFDFRVGFTYKF